MHHGRLRVPRLRNLQGARIVSDMATPPESQRCMHAPGETLRAAQHHPQPPD
jgi:hypothetical protein